MRKLRFIDDRIHAIEVQKKSEPCGCVFYHLNLKEILMIKHFSA